jgi:transmembrane E3 ubiquitin-protein ligase
MRTVRLQVSEEFGLILIFCLYFTQEEDPQTTCSFMFYGQIDPAWMPLQVLREIEAESQEPTGISTPPTPHMGIRGVLLSEDCGILYTINNIDGTR